MIITFDDDSYVSEALRYGAAGYLLKDSPPGELIAAVRPVIEGSVIISPQVANKLLVALNLRDQEKAVERREGDPDPEGLKYLSKRELEILRLIGRGEDNGRIAKELFISEQTVKNHVSVIYSKLNIHSRVKVMKLADHFSEYLASLGR